jgi:hypothetical protein
MDKKSLNKFIIDGIYTLTKLIVKTIISFNDIIDNDPVFNCEVYKKIGCHHIDNPNCDMRTCNILEDYKNKQEMENKKWFDNGEEK